MDEPTDEEVVEPVEVSIGVAVKEDVEETMWEEVDD